MMQPPDQGMPMPPQGPPAGGPMPPMGGPPPENEQTITCPNCGAQLKIEAAAPEAPPQGPPSLRDSIGAAMNGPPQP